MLFVPVKFALLDDAQLDSCNHVFSLGTEYIKDIRINVGDYVMFNPPKVINEKIYLSLKSRSFFEEFSTPLPARVLAISSQLSLDVVNNYSTTMSESNDNIRLPLQYQLITEYSSNVSSSSLLLHFFAPVCNLNEEQRKGHNTLCGRRHRHCKFIPEVAATFNGAWVSSNSVTDFCFVFHRDDISDMKYQCFGVKGSYFMWQSMKFVEENDIYKWSYIPPEKNGIILTYFNLFPSHQ